jgi:hypothetical protein
MKTSDGASLRVVTASIFCGFPELASSDDEGWPTMAGFASERRPATIRPLNRSAQTF